MNTTRRESGAEGRWTRGRRAFTLTELVTVLAVMGLLFLVLTPSLRAARSRSDSSVCLNNLRVLGQCTQVYTEMNDDYLPGPLHPAIYQNATVEVMGELMARRIFTWVVRQSVGDAVTERLVTCPTMGAIVPDSHFDAYGQIHSYVYPTHYVLNNIAATSVRATSPPGYFGVSTPMGGKVARLSRIPNQDREWMIADAWFRPQVNPMFPDLSQEGPYQFNWSGGPMPNFAPHGQPGGRTYSFVDSDTRTAECAEIRQARADGYTNTLFFDGHAASIVSRVRILNGFEVMYGFPGTVNPANPVAGAYWQ